MNSTLDFTSLHEFGVLGSGLGLRVEGLGFRV